MDSTNDADAGRTPHGRSHGAQHKIPTISKYKEFKEQQRQEQQASEPVDDQGRYHKVSQNVRRHWHGADGQERLSEDDRTPESEHGGAQDERPKESYGREDGLPENLQKDNQDTSESTMGVAEFQQRNKQPKKKEVRIKREVTDPVTHLPLTIRDYNDSDLKDVENVIEEQEGAATQGDIKPLSERGRVGSRLREIAARAGREHEILDDLFPPPEFDGMKKSLSRIYGRTMALSLSVPVAVTAVCVAVLVPFEMRTLQAVGWSGTMLIAFCMAAVAGACYMLQGWMEKKAREVWDDEVWEAERRHRHCAGKQPEAETTIWLNRLLSSLWPVVNPSLFSGLADTLEDVMQASLPGLVHMVSIDDLGQGNEPFRILGLKWLPAGAAGMSVTSDGQLKSNNEISKNGESQGKYYDNTGANPTQEGQNDASKDQYNRSTAAADDEHQKDGNADPTVAAGMEAEEGEFVNLEIAFAYRASHTRRRFSDRANNAHLYMAFYLKGNIKMPVWVELKGLVGSVRMRLQLTPDPPFFSLCTLTFLGQPKVDMSCVPLVKSGLNLMDVPLISNFVQSAVDAAMSQYVAPKSLVLDLKAMLAGDDFKRDTSARGVLRVRIKRAFDFKQGDMSIPLVSDGSSDSYVSIGWAKFGKPQWSTRVIVSEQHPYWEEETELLVGSEELDADENLRVQLWDSDKFSADDDLGRIELDLKTLMKDKNSDGKMVDRTDAFQALKAGMDLPGRLEWSVGYFTKTRLQDWQVAEKSGDSEVKTVEQLRQKSFHDSKQKLRETKNNEASELKQLREEDFNNTAIDMISSTVPMDDYPSGILSITIHQILGLELESLNKTRASDGGDAEGSEEVEGSEELPDPYCTVILNHQSIYKTRIKPKNSKPLYNAVTERFVRDWRTTSIFVTARDARLHEEDALLGIAYLDLGRIFRDRKASRFDDFFPLVGGIGYGRVRVSTCFRSVQLQLPRPLLGWDYGTLEIAPDVSCNEALSAEFRVHTLKFKTSLSRAKMHGSTRHYTNADGHWTRRNGHPVRLAVRNRHSSPLIVEFRKHATFAGSKTIAFAVLWLQNISDEQDTDITLTVWKGDPIRAAKNVLPDSEMGERVGELKLKVHFWRGLGKWHVHMARKERQRYGNVMEVLSCAHDHGEIGPLVGDSEWLEAHDGVTSEKDSGSDDSDSEASESGAESKKSVKSKTGGENGSVKGDKGKKAGTGSGLLDEFRSYNKSQEQLHRRHRGVMQWKAPRTLDWMKNKIEDAAHSVEGAFEHSERAPDVETEV